MSYQLFETQYANLIPANAVKLMYDVIENRDVFGEYMIDEMLMMSILRKNTAPVLLQKIAEFNDISQYEYYSIEKRDNEDEAEADYYFETNHVMSVVITMYKGGSYKLLSSFIKNKLNKKDLTIDLYKEMCDYINETYLVKKTNTPKPHVHYHNCM